MKRAILFVTIIFLLSGCNSKYEGHITAGKDALINEKYELAVEEFEKALIEKKNDEEAKSLLSKAELEISRIREEEQKLIIEQERFNMLRDYSDVIRNIYFNYFDQVEVIDFEDYDKQIEINTEALVSMPSSPPQDLFDYHQQFIEFFRLRREAMYILDADGIVAEAQVLIDESNSKLENYFYEVTKYISNHNLDPMDVNWPFY